MMMNLPMNPAPSNRQGDDASKQARIRRSIQQKVREGKTTRQIADEIANEEFGGNRQQADQFVGGREPAGYASGTPSPRGLVPDRQPRPFNPNAAGPGVRVAQGQTPSPPLGTPPAPAISQVDNTPFNRIFGGQAPRIRNSYTAMAAAHGTGIFSMRSITSLVPINQPYVDPANPQDSRPTVLGPQYDTNPGPVPGHR